MPSYLWFNILWLAALCYAVPYISFQYAQHLNLWPLICSLMPFSWLCSVMLTPTIPLYLTVMSFFYFWFMSFWFTPTFAGTQSIKQGLFVQHSVKILNIVIWVYYLLKYHCSSADVVFVTWSFSGRYLREC